MSQHDFDIANQTAANARADINNALKALASLSSGTTAPSTTYANMLWYETDTNFLKMRNEANDGWIKIGYLDQSTDTFSLMDDTPVVNNSGVQQGVVGDQATSTWETGTGTTESLVSPAKVKAAIDALALTVGVGQTWQDVSGSRSANTSYQNTTGKPIQWAVHGSSGQEAQVSSNGTDWVKVATLGAPGSFETAATPVIPNNYYYRTTGSFSTWAELR
jgi:hypothetical protein